MTAQTCIYIVNSLSPKGEGIVCFDDKEIYVEGALPQEEVEIIVGESFVKGSKRHPGKLVRILKKNPHRAPDSQVKSLGGACLLGAFNYDYTLEYKRDLIQKALADIKVDYKVGAIEQSDLQGVVRNKSIRFFGREQGHLINGFYKQRSHEVEKVCECVLEPRWFTEFANALCVSLNDLAVYDEFKHEGLLRSLLLRDCNDERLAMLIVAQSLDAKTEAKYKELAVKFNIKALFICINPFEGNAIVKGEIKSLGESQYIEGSFFDYKFKVGPSTFLQVNQGVAQKLYDEAVAFCAQAKTRDYALDLCCGVGTMTLGLSRHFKRVTGIEIVEASVASALENAQANGVVNVDFIAGDLKLKIKECINSQVNAIIADPSRQGLGDLVCEALAKVPRGTYLSLIFCALPALKRDVSKLLALGFKLCKVKGFDMFPYTNHVETLVLMIKE